MPVLLRSVARIGSPLAARAWAAAPYLPALQQHRACSAAAPSSEAASSTAPPTDAELRMRVLEASMLEVPALGWTTDALSAGAAACGLSPMAHGLLPRGPVELVEFFSASCDASLSADMAARSSELAALETHNKLLVAMQARLQLIAPHRASWAQALALRALPANLPATLRDAHSLSSLLLDVCGEDAKRPLLPHPVDPHIKLISIGAIYGAAELHMLTDRHAPPCTHRPESTLPIFCRWAGCWPMTV